MANKYLFLADRYDNYRAGLLAGGASETDAHKAVEEMRAEDAKIDAGVCPKCGSKITRIEDPRQAGSTGIAGRWFNYRCGNPRSCGWFADRCEPVGEN